MQKIKMLTFHNAENYGAMLQAYALKEILKELGLNAQFVNYENKKILFIVISFSMFNNIQPQPHKAFYQ